MTLEEKLAKELALMEEIAEIIAASQKQYAATRKRYEKIFQELNAANLDDMGWLIQNPTQPGSESAINRKITDLYGFSGPQVSGYMHDGDYNAIQVNFKLQLKNYSNGKVGKERYLDNCTHFIDNYIQFLKPLDNIYSRWDEKIPPVDVIALQFDSEESGLSYLGYDPVENEWYYFTRTYGRDDATKKFANADEALSFAYDLANIEEETDDDDY